VRHVQAEVNNPFYGLPANVGKYAPYNMAKTVLFYPSIFSTSPQQLQRANNNTHMMQHFLAYLQGASLNTTVNPYPDIGMYPWDDKLPPYPPSSALHEEVVEDQGYLRSGFDRISGNNANAEVSSSPVDVVASAIAQ
jgi:hypothetical protein